MPVRKRKHKRSGKVRSRTAAPARAKKPAVAGSEADNGAHLFFPPHYQSEGFTSAGISQFNDKDIPSAVRELIQNSLDAAREIGRRPAIVRFFVGDRPLDDVPGLAKYKEAFEAASAKHKSGGGQTADIIADIRDGLKAEAMPFLFVEDNGVGLNSERMNALLGDGVNVKGGDEAIGSYGNGHLTVFCLSQLRYILYGGVAKNGRMTASGHAILASHVGKDGELFSKDGFYAVNLSRKESVPNAYPEGAQIPPVLKGRLEAIRDEFGSGTVVSVPGFNFFGGNKAETLVDEIRKVAALNFFPAIQEGNLEVRVLENGRGKSLSKSDIADCIERQRDERARNRGGFPTGAKAASSYRTLLEGGEHLVGIDGGSIRLFLRQGAEQGVDMTRVTFCRNGMWITDQVGMLAKTQFDGKAPFDALLLVDAGRCGKFHNLMARAEGRLHIDINSRRLSNGRDRTALRAAFEAVREFLRREVMDSESEEFQPSNFYQIETGQAVGGGKPSSFIRGKAKPVPGTFAHTVAVKRKRAGKKSAAQLKRRAGNTVTARTMAKLAGPNTMEIGIAFLEDCDNCELQMALDNGTDPTCTSPLRKRPLFVHAATVNNGGLALTGEGNKRGGVMLGGAKAGDRRVVRVEFEAGQLRESGLHTVSCEFYRRAAGRANEEGAQ